MKSNSKHAHDLKQDIHALYFTSHRVLYRKIGPISQYSTLWPELPINLID